MIYARCVARTFQQRTIAFQPLNDFLYNFLHFFFQSVLDSIMSTLNIPADTTYMTSFSKMNDITGAPDQVFKFDNFLDRLTSGIRANLIAAIGTINPGSLCLQNLFAPQIHYSLSGAAIAFIGNLFNKKANSA